MSTFALLWLIYMLHVGVWMMKMGCLIKKPKSNVANKNCNCLIFMIDYKDYIDFS